MNKKVFVATILAAILLTGCAGNDSQQPSQLKSGEIKEVDSYEPLEIDLSLNEEESSTFCYADKTQMIFSVGRRNGRETGPLVDTEYVLKYNYQDREITGKYEWNRKSYIANAVPYSDGVLYSTYTAVDDDAVQWEVGYKDAQGTEIIDGGYCSDFENVPAFSIINGMPVYLFEDIGEKSNICGVRAIEDSLETKDYIENKEWRLMQTTLDSNGSQYCFLVKSEETPYLIVGDESGTIFEHEIDGSINAFDINQSKALLALQDQEGQCRLQTIDLNSKKVETLTTENEMYRLKGSFGDQCVCVDWEFKLYQIDIADKTICELELPSQFAGVSPNPTTFYLPISESKYIIMFETDDEQSYYRMSLK